LTDREGDALRASATQLNDWEIKDDKGVPTGVWNIDEASFKKELNNLKTLAQRAIGTTESAEPTNRAKGATWTRSDGTYVSDGTQWVKQ
jgi:hypothetical protein